MKGEHRGRLATPKWAGAYSLTAAADLDDSDHLADSVECCNPKGLS